MKSQITNKNGEKARERKKIKEDSKKSIKLSCASSGLQKSTVAMENYVNSHMGNRSWWKEKFVRKSIKREIVEDSISYYFVLMVQNADLFITRELSKKYSSFSVTNGSFYALRLTQWIRLMLTDLDWKFSKSMGKILGDLINKIICYPCCFVYERDEIILYHLGYV